MNSQAQNGSALLVSLMLLIILTLIAVSAINTSMVNTRIVNNTQAQLATEQLAQAAINNKMSNVQAFYSPTSTSTVVSMLVYDLTVSLSKPICVRADTAEGYSAKLTSNAANITPQDNTWDVQASATDPTTGAKVTINQGVKVRMLNGNCP